MLVDAAEYWFEEAESPRVHVSKWHFLALRVRDVRVGGPFRLSNVVDGGSIRRREFTRLAAGIR
jgi:hypothetical protein